MSHPSRVRGLKFFVDADSVFYSIVAPFAGAWIEISTLDSIYKNYDVAPFAGAWIEIGKVLRKKENLLSHPSRVRGLK